MLVAFAPGVVAAVGRTSLHLQLTRNVIRRAGTLRTVTNSDMSFGGQHTGGSNFLLLDGSWRFVYSGITPAAYSAAARATAASRCR